jgi:hypothetical protein
MTRNEKVEKRERAYRKMGNQLSVLSRTATKKDQKLVEEMSAIYGRLSI